SHDRRESLREGWPGPCRLAACERVGSRVRCRWVLPRKRDSACANREKSLLCPVFFGGSSKVSRTPAITVSLSCLLSSTELDKATKDFVPWPIPPKPASVPGKPRQRGNATRASSRRCAPRSRK